LRKAVEYAIQTLAHVSTSINVIIFKDFKIVAMFYAQ